jgi:hypothetical protein
MLRVEFLKLCLFTGLAGVSGVATGTEELPIDLTDALREIGVTKWSVALRDGILKVRCQVADFDALARKAGSLGDGKVRVARNMLSFERKGRKMELSLLA